MLTINNGIVDCKRITVKRYPNLEQGDMALVNSIVLHRTSAQTASSTLSKYELSSTSEGAHFLIGEDGTIYQTASLIKRCNHVGGLRSRCNMENTCTADEKKIIHKLLHQKNVSWSQKFNDVRDHEKLKTYPMRYATNADSIGIEIVGKIDHNSNAYLEPPVEVKPSLKWLVNELVLTYSLFFPEDIYAHGAIAHKDPKLSEGVASLKWLAKNL